ncbi:MAG TPA: HAD hydrolase-like protein [Acidisarcina sp.]
MTQRARFPAGQTLLIDADDTLWENNIYFERAIASFISYLDHHEYTADEVRMKLNAVERESILAQGYGLTSFRHSLITCSERLSVAPMTVDRHERIAGFAASIAEAEIELLRGVRETLPLLSARHKLILMTKGDEGEQADKFQRSGVTGYFSGVEIPAEKDLVAYTSVCVKHHLLPATTWMIGNSPRSDVNPALAAGLNAVFVRHPHTWVLEHEEISPAPEGQHLIQVDSFAELANYF